MLGGSGCNNPDRIMIVWSSVVVVYKSLIWEITRYSRQQKNYGWSGFQHWGNNTSWTSCTPTHLAGYAKNAILIT